MKVKFEIEVSDDTAQKLLDHRNYSTPFKIDKIFKNKLAVLEGFTINNNVSKNCGIVAFGLRTGEVILKIIE